MLRLFKDINPDRAEAISERAIAIGALSYKAMAPLLRGKPTSKSSADEAVIVHANLRGPGYFH